MEWVETTGQSIDEAQAKALDLLNVDGSDAEIEILEDVKKGLFGRVKSEARVRARIKPKAPAPKDDRRNRRGGGKNRNDRNRGGKKAGNRGGGGRDSGNRDSGNKGGGGRNSGSNASNKDGQSQGNRNKGGQNRDNQGGGKNNRNNDRNNDGAKSNNRNDSRSNDSRGNDGGNRGKKAAMAGAAAAGAGAAGASKKNNDRNRDGQPKGGRNREESAMDEEFSVTEQQEIMGAFVGGVAAVFDAGSSTEVVDLGEDTLEAQVSGENLGLLVGPGGATLAALEELTRTALQRSAGGRRYHRIHVDVDEYRSRRREALGNFALSVAEQVVDSGERKALEPMNAADRKVVHDALTDVEGVQTLSEGDDPRRFVVIAPA